ncbi:hypothetical protein EVAR_29228_1 [Eumeta japonica]|uniref:Uncharacterized protein n=1 Tax=Eumeta variegata TaxID=151549 RepID=A0A4C1VK89_EUMVA|nr:hypothetical protein EVAR_29228_1 [Eumeta japonica]
MGVYFVLRSISIGAQREEVNGPKDCAESPPKRVSEFYTAVRLRLRPAVRGRPTLNLPVVRCTLLASVGAPNVFKGGFSVESKQITKYLFVLLEAATDQKLALFLVRARLFLQRTTDDHRSTADPQRSAPGRAFGADNPGRGQMCPESVRDAFIELSFGQFSAKSVPIGPALTALRAE